ncbi:hypothetical protein LTR64_003647 [Lithohypha guttulata]|uniref:uncharacterized protein n=1 Tax=Lithohypha guttulata TaxID=1690604 RepID=UPI00315DFBE8
MLSIHFPDETWSKFNNSILGRLIVTRPSAAVCHVEDFDSEACTIAKEYWTVSDWRTDQPGAYTAVLWEYGPVDQCFINTTAEALCDQGYVPHYSVNASSVADIQAAVKFADENDVLLTVKNTGHDHLGRSSSPGGGLSIWTHGMRGIEWHAAFVPENAPADVSTYPAVTVSAGEQWIDVYAAAAEQKRVVVGGHARTVGAAGGWFTGGGHSAWSNKYGLGIDNVLELHIVTAAGEHKTLNKYTNSDYFWAIRGGGGCAFGVITSVIYRTYPEPNHIQAVFVQVNATSVESFKQAIEGTFQAIDAMTAAGYTGYAYIQRPADGTPAQPTGFGGFFNLADGNELTLASSARFLELNAIAGVSSFVFPVEYPSWKAYTDMYLTDLNIAQNVIDASRLLTPSVIYNRTKLDPLLDMIVEYGAGFNFIGRVKNDTRAETAVHPAWAESVGVLSFGANWHDEALLEEKRAKKEMVIEQSRRLSKIFGPGQGTYVNEANPFEPEWQDVFWGSNYERLLEIKRKVDPTTLFVCNRCVGTDMIFEP